MLLLLLGVHYCLYYNDAVSIRVDLECGAMPTTLSWNMLMQHLSQATATNTSANTNLFDTHIVV